MFLTTLIQILTSRKTTNHRTTSPRRLRPCLDGLESRVVLNGGWSAPVSYTPPTYVGSSTTPGNNPPTQWTGTLTPDVVTPWTV